MFDRIRDFFYAWGQWKRFKALPERRRQLVFYSEGPGYWSHFERLIDALWREHGQGVVYLTSARQDPVLHHPPEGVTAFYIGAGSVRTLAFAGLQARLVVMTMPDLQTYYIKRSPHVAEYVYVHHSLVSCHMVYRPAAFDHFDTVFCVGPHHQEEIRAREAQAGLPPKRLVEHGYARLEALIEELQASAPPAREQGAPPRILVAPSWGKDALLERLGGDFIAPLLENGCQVTLRPHPQTRRFNPSLLDAILARYGANQRFVLEENVASKRSLLEADLMISDWSGAALEFAFARLKPVLFVDVPRKINNPDYQSLGIEPLEARVRESIGALVAESEAGHMVDAVNALLAEDKSWPERIQAVRDASLYNLGRSGSLGASALVDRLAHNR